jgi:hypothetical protein
VAIDAAEKGRMPIESPKNIPQGLKRLRKKASLTTEMAENSLGG